MNGMILAKRCLFAVWLGLVASAVGGGEARAQGASEAAPPGANHFILLIDASGSVRDTGGYASFLQNDVVARLFEGRIGAKIPAFDPERDVLTLLHFGICPIDECPLASAFRYLSRYDLTTDFVHPAFTRRPHATEDELRARIKPTRYYRYTALSWAEPMAVWMAQASEEDPVARRTFLLAVTDGEPNEHTPQREIRMLQQRADPVSLRETERRVRAVGDAYLFSDGTDREGVAHHVLYPDGGDPRYFLEAYVVLTQDALDWKAQVADLDRPFRLAFRWTQESGAQPEGVLRATLSRALRSRLDAEEGRAWVHFAYEDTSQAAGFAPGGALTLPVAVPGPLGPSPRAYTAVLSVSTARPDSLLGRQLAIYTFPAQTVLTPTPTVYTLRYWTPRALVLLGLLALASLVGYGVYYRFAATHLEIELPGKLKRIRLRRRRSRQHDVAFSSPRKDLPALTLHTPRWMRLFAPLYRGASVTLLADGQAGAAVRWQMPDGRTVELNPITEDTDAFWDRIGTAPTHVTLRFRQGSQESIITLSYPPGDPPSAVSAGED